jgi:N-acetylglutamate synthase
MFNPAGSRGVFCCHHIPPPSGFDRRKHVNWKPPNTETSALAARVEDVCLNVWPALQEIHYDGWLIRLANGQTRRTNSVNILRGGSRPAEEKIGYCESVYGRHGLPTYFRILSTAGEEMDRLLDRRGYDAKDETTTLFMDFARHAPAAPATAVELTPGAPTAEWLAARAQFAGLTPSELKKVEKILQQLALPALFAAVRDDDGAIRSLAKGAVHDDIVCLNLVATDPAFRRQGFSRDCLSAILRWAQRIGATGACLQVVSTNTPAIALYRGLGFTRELYRYHYRHRALGGD